MIEARRNGNIPDLQNGEHRLLQKQIDLMHEDVIFIKHTIGKYAPIVAGAETRSHTNFKLICLLFAGLITVAGTVVVTAVI